MIKILRQKGDEFFMTTISFLHNKKTITMTIEKMVLYKQAKLIEATDRKGQYYIALFYKNDFINIKRITDIKRNSFLYYALIEGNSYSSTHPLTKVFLSQQTNLRSSSSKQMFQHLKDKYNETETLFILTLFNNFYEPKLLHDLCKKTFYHYRRNGQLYKSYKVLISILQADPSHSFASDMIQHLDFQKYQNKYTHYEQHLDELNDPLYIEARAWNNDNKKVVTYMTKLFHDEGRLFDELALQYQLIQANSSPINRNTFDLIDVLLQNITTKQIAVEFWQSLLDNNIFHEAIIAKLYDYHAYSNVFLAYMEHPFLANQAILDTILPKLDTDVLLVEKDKVFPFLIQHYGNNKEQLTKWTEHITWKLLKNCTLDELLDLTSSIELKLPIVQQLKDMKTMENNPDQQYQLGEKYYNLKQYDKAIPCFEWEMELYPDNIAAIQYLEKCYLALNDQTNAKNYQDILVSIGTR